MFKATDLKSILSPKTQRQAVLWSLICGALAVLSLPPFHIIPVLWFVLPVFGLIVIQSQTKKQTALYGFLFFFSYFTAGLYWISYALWVDIAQFWWVLPFALLGLPFALSVLMTIPFVILKRINPRSPLLWWLGLTLAWGMGDIMRSYLFTGFPWNTMASVWMHDITLNIAQNLSWLGVEGLTMATVLLALAPLFMVLTDKDPNRIVVLAASAIALVLMVGYGIVVQKSMAIEQGDTLYRLVQPNIPQKEKWHPEFRRRNIVELMALSTRQSQHKPDIIVWPETAIASLTTQDQHMIDGLIRGNVLSNNQSLVTGVLEADESGLYNNIVVYNKEAEVFSRYSKHHLVPFGEYLPLQDYWPVDPVAFMGEGFVAGTGPDVISVPGGDILAGLICYEVIFPQSVPSNEGFDAILNVTNDAWYGNTTGPRQHLAQARMRAIENRVTVLRVANTGISAVYDPFGRERGRIPLQHGGIIDTPLYKIIR